MRTFWLIFTGFFKCGWNILSFIRKLTLNIFFIFFIVIAIDIYLKLYRSQSTLTKSALIVDLIGTVVDKPTVNNKVRQFLGTSKARLQEHSLFDIVNKLRQAKNDNKITGLVLSLKNFSGTDLSSLHYIGKGLKEFRDSGKPIYAIGDSYSQSQYFLASYANKIYLTPQGAVDLHGMSINHFYYKSLLDKLKVNSHIFRVGTYKSAVEPFLRNNMSDAARKNNNRLINQLWKHYLTIVANNRQIEQNKFFPKTEDMLEELRIINGDTAQFALNHAWIDQIIPFSTMEKELIKTFGWNKSDHTFNGISIYDYQQSQPPKGQIAVIFINGTIIDTLAIPGAIGSETITNQIRHARLNPKIKAIVLRINSPGGSVTTSEIIRSELVTTRKAGKPVVVSMGSIAASGGYWISTAANYIVASHSTLTGSIGVFGIINTFEDSLDSIGIHSDGVTTSPVADISITKTLSEEYSQMMKLSVENSYHNFITLVAQSRNKTLEEIDEIGQGRVWIGSDAMVNGLIDQLGDFDDAVIKAAELAKLKKYTLNWYLLDEPGLIELLFTKMCMSIYTQMPNIFQSFLSVNQFKINGLDVLNNDPKNRYALCVVYGQIT
ncbi:signal peptide peptidase SppA [Candidatus Curculioniphilus buchneri]|uniref:signal peptide peptidase SppA n=1 Tax=Candidatus Curculioniphilus buchneri TaxID=690594 RepID=UPI00376F22B7